MRRRPLLLLAAMVALPVAPALAADPTPAPAGKKPASAGRTPAPPGAYCYIGWPNNGEVVKSPFKVWFGLRGMGVAPAGVEKPNTGHHHLLIDTDLPPMDEPIPNNKNHLHFGGGQTETVLDLPPGRHTLQLLLGDANHVPFNPPVMSKKITITVKE
jgi:hypothetical protein